MGEEVLKLLSEGEAGRWGNWGCDFLFWENCEFWVFCFFRDTKAVALDCGGDLRVFYVGRRWVGLM